MKTREELLKDRITVKLINRKRPGTDIQCSVNGMNFNYPDNSIQNVPRCVLNTLNEAVAIKWVKDPKNPRTLIQVDDPRFTCIPVADELAESAKNPKQKERDKIFKQAVEVQGLAEA